MFYERFDFENDENTSEFSTSDLWITYFVQQIYSESDFIKTNVHEWLHGLFEWATEDEATPTEKQDHYIMRSLGWD
jgi:hypothetical protein